MGEKTRKTREQDGMVGGMSGREDEEDQEQEQDGMVGGMSGREDEEDQEQDGMVGE